MIKIEDEKGLLNLNHMAIYLMLTAEEIALYSDKLKDLNRYTSLTRKLFRFDIIEKGDAPYEELPDAMKRNMRHYNVLVRLVNSIHGIFCYGMEEIDFKAELPEIVKELKIFIDDVCNEDIKQLDILCSRVTSTSVVAAKQYRDNNMIKEVFEAALEGEDVDTALAKARLEATSSSTDIKTSLSIASSATDGIKEKKDNEIEKERCERERPLQRPLLTMTIKKVWTGKEFKGGRQEKKLGIELNINGTIIPVWFGSVDQTFLYMITLIACLEGRTIKRSDFQAIPLGLSKTVSERKEIERQEFKIWLKRAFCALQFGRDFSDWYINVADEPHPLDVAMGQIKKKLWNFLHLQCKDAYYYCFVVNKNGCYTIRGVDKNHIFIDPDIEERLYH